MTAAYPQVLVLGTGALACYLGGLLARSGRAAVTLAGTWPEGLHGLREHGITVEEEGGVWHTPVRAVSLDEVHEPADFVLVLVKAYRTAAVAPVAARATAGGGLVVSLQNGWGNRETLAAHAAGRVAAGVIVAGATLLGPAHVRAFVGQVLVGVPPAASGGFAELLRAATLPAETTQDIDRHLWRKLAANCSINPLTALLRVTNGALLEDPQMTARLVAAAREVGAVASARGIDLGGDAGALAVAVARRTSANHSSMLQDVARGAPTEIDALCGAMSEEGRRLGVPTPVNDELLAAVHALSAGVARVKVVARVSEVRAWRDGVADTVGLVPTMGYLHAGHVSLVERARRENGHVAATLFVNPTQFGPREDLARYPRDLDRDRRLLEAAGCDLLFAPTVDEVYPAGFDTFVDVGAVAAPLEGARRPGHFRGVATVVLKLLNIVRPDRAYFGQKDAQQLAVIRKVVADLDVPVEVVACPTVRDADGLALSSRNSYLGPEDRAAAPVLYRALTAAADRWRAGERSAEALRGVMRNVLAAEPRARTDYVSVADPATLKELDTIAGPTLLSMAVRVGPARLIDNVLLEG